MIYGRPLQWGGEILRAAAGDLAFYNISPLTLQRVLADPTTIADQLHAYLAGFSEAARDVIEKFEFDAQITRLARANLLYLVVSRFCDPRVDLHPDKVSNLEMGYLYEELIRTTTPRKPGLPLHGSSACTKGNLAQKAEVIIEHFRRHVRHKIGGRAKAMVVTASRLHAVRYVQALRAYCNHKGYDIGALVAFSGTVLPDTEKHTESSLTTSPSPRRSRNSPPVNGTCLWSLRSIRPGSTSHCCTRCTWTSRCPGSPQCRRCRGSTAKDDRDLFQLHLGGLIANSMGAAVAANVSSSIHTVDGADVCRVHVHASGFPVDAKVTVDRQSNDQEDGVLCACQQRHERTRRGREGEIHLRTLAHPT